MTDTPNSIHIDGPPPVVSTDTLASGNEVVTTERVKPDGIPDDAWLAMQAIRNHTTPQESVMDRFLERQRSRYGTK